MSACLGSFSSASFYWCACDHVCGLPLNLFHLLFDGSSTGSVKKKSSPLNSPTPRNELCNMKVSKDFGNNFESS